jgi:predicted RNA binding protein YcfA (HicA-like mRNA interferase family)
MDPQDQLIKLLRDHNFDLVRQRKHKIYRNPDGLTFVAASTPSDRHAPQNALSTLKRILRHANATDESPTIIDAVPMIAAAPVSNPVLMSEHLPIERAPEPMSDQEWEAWKYQYWRDERLRAKNEKFLSVVNKYVGRVSELMHKKMDKVTTPATAADAIKSMLRELHYKSKVVLYRCRFFDQGIVDVEIPDQPILWSSNGHIGISAFLYFNAYVQHGPSRATTLRFNIDGTPVLFELPEQGARKFHVPY